MILVSLTSFQATFMQHFRFSQIISGLLIIFDTVNQCSMRLSIALSYPQHKFSSIVLLLLGFHNTKTLDDPEIFFITLHSRNKFNVISGLQQGASREVSVLHYKFVLIYQYIRNYPVILFHQRLVKANPNLLRPLLYFVLVHFF